MVIDHGQMKLSQRVRIVRETWAVNCVVRSSRSPLPNSGSQAAPTLILAKSTSVGMLPALNPSFIALARWHLPCDVPPITTQGQDSLMKRQRRAGWITMFLTLAWTTGCSRQLAVPASGSTPGNGQLPFDRVSDSRGLSPTAPFTTDRIPAGTEVTVRLQVAFSSADSRAGDSFQAVLDEAVIVDGKTLVPRGTPVTGSVIAAKAAGDEHDPGYLRVTLVSMALDGKSIPLQTSGIFAKGGAYARRKIPTLKNSDPANQGVVAAVDSGNDTEPSLSSGHADARFSTGRRLTFRLAQPLHLSS